ncbi:MAG TPA: ATP-binding protein [Candidatus Saccharimonadales bacterium]|nr:ATP-binding protein [Candidatus Saccharimonadales bacterium]
MPRPILYLMIGYPGAGKTTVAEIIHDATGAVHLWSDIERHKLFGHPTHSEEESVKLYDELNRRAGELLAAGQSVVFDTNFNFRTDRQKLRDIADRHGADTLAIWVQVPKEVARERVVSAGQVRNGYHTAMSEERFDRIVSKLEPPTADENFIKIDGTKLDRQTVLRLLSQYYDAHAPSS